MKINKWLPIVIACSYCVPGISHAADSVSSYYCVVEASGGLFYNESTKKWIGASFRDDAKYVLRLERVGQRTEKDVFYTYETVTDYKISITRLSGENHALPCNSRGTTDQIVKQRGNSGLYCTDGLTDFGFNITKGRFLTSYMRGFLYGQDNNADNPAMAGGTCTEIQ